MDSSRHVSLAKWKIERVRKEGSPPAYQAVRPRTKARRRSDMRDPGERTSARQSGCSAVAAPRRTLHLPCRRYPPLTATADQPAGREATTVEPLPAQATPCPGRGT